jgi:hypothetical protein
MPFSHCRKYRALLGELHAVQLTVWRAFISQIRVAVKQRDPERTGLRLWTGGNAVRRELPPAFGN